MSVEAEANPLTSWEQTDAVSRPNTVQGRIGLRDALPRLAGITAILARYSAEALVRSLWLRLIQRGNVLSATGAALAQACESLGGGFLKIGQVLSTRVDILPLEMAAPLGRLQDSVTPFPAETAQSIVECALGQRIDLLFLEFDPKPIGSASVAQVHRAVLRNSGREVAVKIRRPAIERRMRIDGRVFLVALRLVVRLPYFRDIPLFESGSEIVESIQAQTDFRLEAHRHLQFQNLFADETGVRVPRLLPELCAEEVLVMEYFPGLTKITTPELDSRTHRMAVIEGLRALYRMIFLAGLVHCDLHPGNVLVHGGTGSVALIDFGFATEMSPARRRAFARFFINIALNNGPASADLVLQTASKVPTDLNREAFVSEISSLVKQVSGAAARDFLVASFVKSLFDIQRRHRVYGSPDFTMAILSLMVYEGIIRYRCADLDFQREAVPILLSFLKDGKYSSAKEQD